MMHLKMGQTLSQLWLCRVTVTTLPAAAVSRPHQQLLMSAAAVDNRARSRVAHTIRVPPRVPPGKQKETEGHVLHQPSHQANFHCRWKPFLLSSFLFYQVSVAAYAA